jgi:Holliday junction DNA helicase RuvA
MIAYLSGKLLEKTTSSVIIDVGGVGYDVSIPLSTFYDLGEIGSDASLRIYTHVREDAIQLFGFKTLVERDVFLRLISVSGIGAKSAVGILSGMSADELVNAIRSNNLAKLNAIPGIGKKTAERIVVELRDKINTLATGAPVTTSLDGEISASGNAAVDDAVSALVNLGYQKNAAEKAIKEAMQEGTEISVQKLLRRSLQLLAKG